MKRFILAASILLVTTSAHSQTPKSPPAWKSLDTSNPFAMIEKYEAKQITDVHSHHFTGIFIAAFKNDFNLAFQRINTAKEYANKLNDDEFSRAISNLKTQMFIWSGMHSTILENKEELGGGISPLYLSAIEYWDSLMTKTERAKQTFTLHNIAESNNRIEINGHVNQVETRFLFDTGGDSILLNPSTSKAVGAKSSDIKSKSQTVDKSFTTSLGHVDMIKIGLTSFINYPVNVPDQELSNIRNYNGRIPDAVLGIDEIRQIGQTVNFIVNNNRVTKLNIIPEQSEKTQQHLIETYSSSVKNLS